MKDYSKAMDFMQTGKYSNSTEYVDTYHNVAQYVNIVGLVSKQIQMRLLIFLKLKSLGVIPCKFPDDLYLSRN